MRRPAALFLVLLLSACSRNQGPAQPLAAGYYKTEGLGYVRRIIVFTDRRKISYDLWHVPAETNGNARHAHFDLVGSTASPVAGDYAVTQDGSDCGTAHLEPYVVHGKPVTNVIVFEYHGAQELFGGGGTESPDVYDDWDKGFERSVAADTALYPDFYDRLGFIRQWRLNRLEPVCTG